MSAFIFWFPSDDNKENWITFEKEQNVIKTNPTSKADKEKHNLLQSRPAQKLKLIGKASRTDVEEIKKLYKSRIDSDWVERFGKILLDGQEKDIKLFIKKIQTVVSEKNDQLQFREIVTITFSSENGEQTSFRALIDPLTLKVEKKWDRTIVENYIERPKGLTPSGKY